MRSPRRINANGRPLHWDVVKAVAAEFGLVFVLIFGGCCSNAWALESTTKILPASGSLLTLVQFASTALVALWGQLEWHAVGNWTIPSVKRPVVPLRRWIIQVVLYYATSLLNNSAFAYHIPMSVHIVFRSGGMVVNMLLGWAVDKKHYSFLQIASVAIVSIGVVVATISAAQPAQTTKGSTEEYVIGVVLLSLALLSSGTMGIFQEHTYAMYGREHWHEALFYSHLFALPLFLLNWQSITRQIKLANATRLEWVGTQKLGVYVPSYYIVLLLNVLTQLLCVNGVNRLTSRVSSVSVSLVLVVRKAVSLVISVVWLNGTKGNTSLWGGATAVMLGTVGYTYGGLQSTPEDQHKKKA